MLLLAVLLHAYPVGAQAQPKTRQPAGIAVEAWITTGDRSSLLARDTMIAFGGPSTAVAVIDVDSETRYQEMVGFGAAITDSSAWLMQKRMNVRQRNALLEDLFGPAPGIGLSFT
ncbi:MAG: hypothetical protein WCV99_17875, partial [Sterolibacterium sp.]